VPALPFAGAAVLALLLGGAATIVLWRRGPAPRTRS